MKFFKWFFGFGAKYKKKEEEYAKKSRKHKTSGELLTVIFNAVIPILCLWGAFKVPFSDLWPIKVLCIAGCLSIFMLPKESMILAIVALRHRIKMKALNKIHDTIEEKTIETLSGQELSEEKKQEIAEEDIKGTANKYDLAVGIVGIVSAVLSVIVFFCLLFAFIFTPILK